MRFFCRWVWIVCLDQSIEVVEEVEAEVHQRLDLLARSFDRASRGNFLGCEQSKSEFTAGGSFFFSPLLRLSGWLD